MPKKIDEQHKTVNVGPELGNLLTTGMGVLKEIVLHLGGKKEAR